MENKFKDGEGISWLAPTYDTLNNHFDEVEAKLNQLTDQLAENTWSGDMKNNCQGAHEALVLYLKQVREICAQMKKASGKLEQKATEFGSTASCLKYLSND